MQYNEVVADAYDRAKLIYIEGFDSFCFQNCLRLLLEFKNVSNSVLYINSSMSLIYDVDENSKTLLRCHADTRSLISEYSQKVYRYYYDINEDPMKVFQTNLNVIEKSGTPIIVGVDTFYLPYASNYKKNHAMHTALLCGYEPCNNKVHLIDWYFPWLFKGTVDLEEFIAARCSQNQFDGTVYSGSPILNNWAVIKGNIHCKKPVELLEVQLKLSIEQYYSKGYPQELQGARALERFFEDFTKVKDYKTEYKHFHNQLYVALKRHKLFRNFLIIVNDNLKIEAIESLSHSFEELTNLWETVLMLITKVGLKGDDNSIKRLNVNFEKCIEKENLIGDEVISLYQKVIHLL